MNACDRHHARLTLQAVLTNTHQALKPAECVLDECLTNCVTAIYTPEPA